MKRTTNIIAAAAMAIVLVSDGGQNLFGGTVDVLTDDFGNPNGGWTVYDAPAAAIRSNDTGFRWTAHAASMFFAFLDSGSTTLLDSRLNGHMTGSYTYTIFDSTGGNTPDTSVRDLMSATIEWSGVGSSGTATAGIIVRDANGDWFLSDQTVPIIGNTSQTLSATTATWQSLSGTVSTLDDVTDDDTGPLTIGPAATPDLSLITGGGYYIASDTYTATEIHRPESITFTAIPEPSSVILLLPGIVGLFFRGRTGKNSARSV